MYNGFCPDVRLEKEVGREKFSVFHPGLMRRRRIAVKNVKH